MKEKIAARQNHFWKVDGTEAISPVADGSSEGLITGTVERVWSDHDTNCGLFGVCLAIQNKFSLRQRFS